MNRQGKPSRPILRYGDDAPENELPEFVAWQKEVERAIAGEPLTFTSKPKPQRPVLRVDLGDARKRLDSFQAPDEPTVESFQQELARRRAAREQAEAVEAQRLANEGQQYGTARRIGGKLVQPAAEIASGLYGLPATMARSRGNIPPEILEAGLGGYGQSVDQITEGLQAERVRLAALPADAGKLERGANFAADVVGEAAPVVAGAMLGGAPVAVAGAAKFAQSLGQGRTPTDAAKEGAFSAAGTFVGLSADRLAHRVAPALSSSSFGQRLVRGGVAGAAGGSAGLAEGALRDEDPELTEMRGMVQAAISAALAAGQRPTLKYDSRAPVKAKVSQPQTSEPTFGNAVREFVADEGGSANFAQMGRNIKTAVKPARNTTQHPDEVERWLTDLHGAVKTGKAKGRLSTGQIADLKDLRDEGLDALERGDGAAYIRAREQAVEMLGKDASWGEKALDVLNVPRSLLASMDMSYPFRQGGLGLLNFNNLNPVRAKARVGEFRDMVTAGASKRGFDDIRAELRGHPRAPLAEDAGLYSATGSTLKINHHLLDREESFASTLAEKIPLVGRGIKASDRAFVAAGDLQRLHLFDGFAKQLEKRGVTFDADPKSYQDIARFVNVMSGRGEIHDKLKSLEPVLNGAMFSPKFFASRLQVLNPATYGRMTPEARRIALKEVAGFVGAASTVLGLAAASGAEVGMDPTSSDFAKIKVGNTRYDILGGLQQPIVFLSREAKALYARQKGQKLKPNEQPGAVAERFARTKMSPAAGAAYDAAVKNSNFEGYWNEKKPFDYSKAALDLVTPLMIRDLKEAFDAEGMTGVFKTLPAGVGFGVQTFEDRKGRELKPKAKPKPKSQRTKKEVWDAGEWFPPGRKTAQPWPPPMIPLPPEK